MGVTSAMLYVSLTIVMIAIQLSCATVCKHELLSLSPTHDGYITSPGYPQQYSPELCIIYIYHGRAGMNIYIRFIDVDIPSDSESCDNDHLRISAVTEHVYCGNINSLNIGPYISKMTSAEHRLSIVFNSTSVRPKGRGFSLYYEISDAFNMSATSTTSTYSVDRYDADMNSCHFVFADKFGEITTNQTVLDCLKSTIKVTWLIHYPGLVDINTRYKIIFKKCRLPDLDTLNVYNGFSNTDNLVGSYSGSSCPTYLISSYNGVFIEYLAGGTGVLPALKLQFRMIGDSQTDSQSESSTNSDIPTRNPVYQDQCNFQLSDQSGEITSDYVSRVIQSSGYCTWLLRQPSAEKEKVTYTLTLERFQLSTDSIFNIYDGSDMTAPVLGSYFPMMQSSSMQSSQDSIYIYYNPGINVGSVGVSEVFTIKYYMVVTCAEDYLPCGYEEQGCFNKHNRCDGIWHCPLHGGDERGCFSECPTDFSCGYASSGCYSENERCNGKGICPNNFDEMACNELHCSSDKGLFLCSNRRCVYETLRCNRMNDCLDNSDEDDCSTSPSTRVIFAAVVCTLICALVLVSAMGCVCKVYRRHVHHLNGGHRHETPLSRQLSEMLHRRAPPPPYHEAMLTSRPYSEAHLELPNQAEQQQPELLGAINNGYLEDTEPELLRQQLLSRQSNERSGPNQPQHSLSNILHHYSTRLGLESDRLGDVDSLLLFSEVIGDAVQHDETTGRERTSNRDLPAHSETGASTVSYPCSSGDTWQEDVEDILRDDNFHAPCDEESLIQMEFLPSTDVHLHVADQPSTVSKSRNSTDIRLLPPIHHCGSSDEVAKDTISTGTDNPVDSSRIVEEHDDKIQEDDINLIDEDSDSDCILAENCVDHDEDDVDDGDSTDSDSVCILDQV